MSIELTTTLVGEEEPMQPVGKDPHGVHRFLENRIVQDLLERSRVTGFSLNEIAVANYTQAERRQLAQLIGYSVCGYLDLSYVNDDSAERASLRDAALSLDLNEE